MGWHRGAPRALPLSAAQRKELDRRKREHSRDPSEAKLWPKYTVGSKNGKSDITASVRG
jgi:hypothetical protein